MSKYNHQPSSYCYPGSDVLKNKNNIRDPESLEKFERILSTWRISQLSERPIAGNFDLEHLELIHHYIFQDIYSFAVELRTESMAKDQFVFALPQYIQLQADQLFVQLKEEQQLRNLSAKKFAERAAHYMAEINVIHPFREGNVRAQREFIRSLAYANGYALQWERTDPQQLLQASIRSISNIDSLSRHIYLFSE